MAKSLYFFLPLLFAAFFWMPADGVCAENTSKDAHKAVRELKKQGWSTLSGKDDELETQIANLFTYMSDTCQSRYIVETRTVKGRDYPSARKQALASAKAGIASGIESNIVSICEQVVVNRNEKNRNPESVNSLVASARNIALQNIGTTPVLVEIYRNLPDGGVEVRLSVCFDTDTVRKEIM